jgi:hypothetical protein
MTYPGRHPSGIVDEGELADVSMEFWMTYSEGLPKDINTKLSHLLAFQQGYYYSRTKKYD